MKANLPVAILAFALNLSVIGCATNEQTYAVGSPLAAAISGTGSIKEIREVSSMTAGDSLKKRVMDNVNFTTLGLTGYFAKKKVQEGEDRPGAVTGSTTGRETDVQAKPKIYQVEILMDDGSTYTFEKESIYGLKPGDRVRLENGNMTKI